METILIVDADPAFHTSAESILEEAGYHTQAAASVAQAIGLGEKKKFDLVLSATQLPDGDGMHVLDWWKEHAPDTPVVLTAAEGSIASAVDSLNHGASDCLEKPLHCPEELRLKVAKVLEQVQISGEREWLREEEGRRFCSQHILTDDPRMEALSELVYKVAPAGAPILIEGEAGTGKEVLARAIHASSSRAGRIFVRVNCASLPPAILETTLFGWERAAGNGGAPPVAGRLERAHGGTLFLDEVSALDSRLQERIVRLLQEKTFQRVNGIAEIVADVRIIAATDRDLEELSSQSLFRDDLYFRLNMFRLQIPPLRERPGDILQLSRIFLARAAKRWKRPMPELTPEAEMALIRYDWPGNIRELDNLMERVALLANGNVTAELLPLPVAEQKGPFRVKDIERRAIVGALKRNNNNRTKTARELGISVRTLQYRLKQYAEEGIVI